MMDENYEETASETASSCHVIMSCHRRLSKLCNLDNPCQAMMQLALMGSDEIQL